MEITKKAAAEQLLQNDSILIIAHMSPDGDTLGSAFSLYHSLKQLGKKVRVDCSDIIPYRFDFITKDYIDSDFEPEFIVAVDVAATQLIGDKLSIYIDRIDLCIDHHPSNELFAKNTLLVKTAAAACEIMYDVICELGADITKQIANCLYTGIATDCGCFKYSNTTEHTHRVAAELFKYGAEYEWINRYMFDTKSKSRILIEQLVLNSIEYYYNDLVAIIVITQNMVETAQADESELDGVSSIPRMIEGVEVGITIREKEDGSHKVSIRTAEKVDASKLCAIFNGGGHKRAAGCLIKKSCKTTKKLLLQAIEPILKELEV